MRLCLLASAHVTNMATANAGIVSTLLCILSLLLITPVLCNVDFNECYCSRNCNIIVLYIGAVEVQMKGVQLLMLITNTTM